MDLRQLEYVEAVARHGSFTRAAEEVHVAQPALSHAIRRLEDELGVRLFDRTSRRVVTTDAGRAFLDRAERVTGELSRLVDEMRDFAEGGRGRLRISAWYHAEPRLTRFLRDYIAASPEVEVAILELASPDAVEALRTGQLDVALILVSPGEELRGLDSVVVRSEPYVIVVPPDHRLAGRTSVGFAEILDERFIVTRPGTALRRCFDRAFVGRAARPHIAIETNELAATVAFVSAGLGCAILTKTIVSATSAEIVIATLSDAEPFTLAAAWTPGDQAPAVQRAIDLVVAGASPEPAGA